VPVDPFAPWDPWPAAVFQSWISSGTNQPIGRTKFPALSGKRGLRKWRLGSDFPLVIDRLTPNGKLPEERATAWKIPPLLYQNRCCSLYYYRSRLIRRLL